MNINKIEPKKKYWKVTRKLDSRTRQKNEEWIAVFVVEVNHQTKQVLASYNGMAAEWHSASVFGRWKATKPQPK